MFSVTKVSSLFVCSHTVSRHSNAPDFYFVIEDGVPVLPSEEQTPLVQGIINGMTGSNGKPGRPTKFKATLDELFSESEPIGAKELIVWIQEKLNCSHVTAYKIVNNSLDDGIISKIGKTFVANI